MGVFPTSRFSRLVSADDHIGPTNPIVGLSSELWAHTAWLPSSVLYWDCAGREGAKAHPRDIVMGPSGGSVSCPKRTFFGLTTCHLEAKQAAVPHVF